MKVPGKTGALKKQDDQSAGPQFFVPVLKKGEILFYHTNKEQANSWLRIELEQEREI